MLLAQEGQTGYDVRKVYDDETGVLRMQQITRNGLPHSPPDGEASHIAWDEQGRCIYMKWHSNGEENRVEGPSTIYMNPETGVHETEVFCWHGHPRPQEHGPHVVRRDPVSGQVAEIIHEPGTEVTNSGVKNTGP